MFFHKLFFVNLIIVFVECRTPTIFEFHDHFQAFKNVSMVSIENFNYAAKVFRSQLFDVNYKLININGLRNLTYECMEDMILIAAEINLTSYHVPNGFGQTFGILIDAQGKEPPAILRGATKWYGSKQECDMIYFKVPQRKRIFEASYSRLFLDSIALSGGNKTCDPVTSYLLGFDVCLPKSCDDNDIFAIAEFIFEYENMTDALCSVTTMDDIKVEYDFRSYIVMTVIGIILVVVIAASILDCLILLENSQLRLEKGTILFLAFSFPRNVAEILSVGKSSQKGQITSIHFIRFISITWVIVCHCIMTYMMNMNNYLDMFSITDYPMTQLIINGFFSVDNFFFIGAVLVAFLFFKELEKNRKTVMSVKGWIMFYLHRYLRLSPSYFMAIAFSAWIYIPWASQRVSHLTQTPAESTCNKHFWEYVLYINNIRMDRDKCFAHAWYLAADMQMYVLSPIILIPLALSPIFGIIIVVVLFSLSTAGNIITVYINHYPPTIQILPRVDPGIKNADDYTKLMYFPFWIRCQVYIMGLLVGWFMQKRKTLKIPKFLQLVFWLLSIALMNTVLFGLYDYNRGKIEIPLFWRAMYSAFHRPTWTIGLAWIILSCYYGYGGILNRFLSWNIWVPLGRLSYAAYLIHYTIVLDFIFAENDHAVLYTRFWDLFWSHVIVAIVLSFVFALIWSSLFEIPIGKIESILLRPSRSEFRVKNKESLKINGWNIENLTENGKNQVL